jgi:hypothetical protein
MKQFNVFNVQFEGRQRPLSSKAITILRFDEREVEDLDNLDSALAERIFELVKVYPQSFNYQETE